ncbi:hypothetical protein MASR2M39_28440 [Ignavibacteriales bacterium]
MEKLSLYRWLKEQLYDHLRNRDIVVPAILFSWIELNYENLLKSHSLERGEFVNSLIIYHKLLLDAVDYRSETLQTAIDRDLNLKSFSVNTFSPSESDSVDHQILIADRQTAYEILKTDAEPVNDYKKDNASTKLDGSSPVKWKGKSYYIIEPMSQEEFAPEEIIKTLAVAVNKILSSKRKSVSILIDSPQEMIQNYIYTALLVKYRFQNLKSLSLHFVEHAEVKNRIEDLIDLKGFSRRYGIAEYCNEPFLPSKWINSNLTMKDIYDLRKDETIPSLRITRKRHFPTGPPYRKLSQDEIEFIDDCKISDSKHRHSLRKLLEVVSLPHQTILLLGETGVGKSFIAKKLHEHSNRKDKPFRHINCAAISPDLLESELFGAEANSFTGAIKLIKGKIELAEGGVLFLDELTEATPDFQSKLLTFLDTWEYYRIRGEEKRTSDVNLIVAFNRDPETAISEGKLRGDLYYRISAFSFCIPPLRERKNELGEIITDVFNKKKDELGLQNICLTNESLNYLKKLPWLGNFRELENEMNKFLSECNFLNSNSLTLTIIKDNSILAKDSGKLGRLEEILEEFFLEWEDKKIELLKDSVFSAHFEDQKGGPNFINGIIKPVLANMFEKKFEPGYHRKDVSNAIGMDWTHGSKSEILKHSEFYQTIEKYFKD